MVDLGIDERRLVMSERRAFLAAWAACLEAIGVGGCGGSMGIIS